MAVNAQRVQAIFCLAVEAADAAARAGILARECGSDAELRQRIEALLRVHDDTGDFLQRPLQRPETVDAPAITEGPGTRIGKYKLLQQIGEGGMGVVFMAEQTEPVQRRVALKIVKPGMDTRQVVARFEAERQALALMDHPHIAKVHDAGATESGRPFFVMELVKGVTITKYCDDHRLSPRQRLELFVPICQAVQHAHQKGIIHRDLKPSNIIVALYDGRPVPKVIDFGIAKATGQKLTDKTFFTDFGAVVGTLEYMSPEQAEVNQLDIDTRSDIYALGVVLYQLLTGSTPLQRQQLRSVALLECLRIIREQEPPKPSARLSTTEELPSIAAQRGVEPKKLSRLVRGDLDWIVMKCLEKDRNRRYETANGLAMDVQRYLSDEPVLACPPSVTYRFSKFVGRHRRQLTTAGIISMVLLLAAVGIGWAVWEQVTQQERAHAQLVKEVTAALEKVRTLRQESRGAEAQAVLEQTRDRLGPDAPQELRQRVQLAAAEWALVDRVQEIRLRRSEVVANQFDSRTADQEYADTFRNAGLGTDKDPPEVVAARLRGTSVTDQLVAAVDDWAATTEDEQRRTWLLAIARHADPDAWRDRFRDPAAWADRTRLEALAKELLDDEQLLTAQQPQLLNTLAVALSRPQGNDPQVRLKANDSSPSQVPRLQGHVLPLLKAGQRRYPDDFWLSFSLGRALYFAGQSNEAVAMLRATVAVHKSAAAAHNSLGSALRAEGRVDEAVKEYRRAAELDPKFSWPHTNLARVWSQRQDLDEAVKEYRLAMRLDAQNLAAHERLAWALLENRQWDDAAAAFRQALELDADDYYLHEALGVALAEQHSEEAAKEFRRVLELKPPLFLPRTGASYAQEIRDTGAAVDDAQYAVRRRPIDGSLHHRLGRSLLLTGRFEQARASFRRCLELLAPEDGMRPVCEASLESCEVLRAQQALLNHGAIDGKDMQVIGKSSDFRLPASNALLGGPMRVGDWADVRLPAARDGMYHLVVYLCRGWRFGIVQLHLNGAKLGEPIDAFQPTAARVQWLPIGKDLGPVALKKGDNTLRLELVGVNPKSLAPNYNWGLFRVAMLEAAPGQSLADALANAERLAQARFSQEPLKQLYTRSARMYAEAFASDARLADDLYRQYRYRAACAAALAGSGQGKDAARLDTDERARLRRQALGWLRADLELWGKRRDYDKIGLRAALTRWQDDPALAGVRDPDAVDRWPAEEQAACRQLWRDVAVLSASTGELVLVTGGLRIADVAPTVDGAGTLYYSEWSGHRIWKRDAKGKSTCIAGIGKTGPGGDGGPATKAGLDWPQGILLARNGDLLVADSGNHRVRRIDVKTGIITTIAGNGTKGFSGDGGPAVRAALNVPTTLAFNAMHEKLYVADLHNQRVRMVDLTSGMITTVAGNGTRGLPKDGDRATQAPLIEPRAIAVDRAGNLYIGATSGHALRVVDREGRIWTVVGNGKPGLSGDGGPAKDASLQSPAAVHMEPDGNVLIAHGPAIRRYLPKEGRIVRVAGTAVYGNAGLNGPPEQAQLNRPLGLTVSPSGTIYIADTENNRIVKIDPEPGRKRAAILAGKSRPANDAERLLLAESCRQQSEKLYATSARCYAELFANDAKLADDVSRMHRYHAASAAALAGCGQGHDAPWLDAKERARLRRQAVAWLRAELAYWSRHPADDKAGVRTALRRFESDPDLAGLRDAAALDKLPAAERAACRQLFHEAATLLLNAAESLVLVSDRPPGIAPNYLAFDAAGNLYYTDWASHRVWKRDAAGTVTCIAGTGKRGFGGDGGPALKATFNSPESVLATDNGDLWIADTHNHRVRKIDAKTQNVTTVFGTGKQGFSGDTGPAAEAAFNFITSMAFDAKREKLYLADASNRRVRMVDLASGKISTVAGNGIEGAPRDGDDATKAPLVVPRTIALDRAGRLYIADQGGHALRVVDGAGRIWTVAGTGKTRASGDGGPAKDAILNVPVQLLVEPDGNILIADHDRICRYLPKEARIVRVAGSDSAGQAGLNGTPELAKFNLPLGLALGPSGSIYIADTNNQRIVKIEPDPGAKLPAILTGQAQPANDAERLFFAELCRRPHLEFYAAAARLYAEAFAHDPRLADDMTQQHRYHAAGAAALAGGGQGHDTQTLDQPQRARLCQQAVAWLQADLRYWRGQTGIDRVGLRAALGRWRADPDLAGIRDPAAPPPAAREACRQLWQDVDGLLAGSRESLVLVADGPKVVAPHSIAFDPAGNMYYTESSGPTRVHRVWKKDPLGAVTCIAGTGQQGFGGDGGRARDAIFNSPETILVMPNGDLWIADTWNCRVRQIDVKTGMITTIIGGRRGFGGDGGPAVQAAFANISAIAFDAQRQKLYVTDLDNQRVRVVDLATRIITTVAGNGQKGVPKDGELATKAPLVRPRSIAVDRAGNLYIADLEGHALRVVDPGGKIWTVAGTGSPGQTGDGGPAKQATLESPWQVCVEPDGNVLIATATAIRRYLPREGRIVRVAGTDHQGNAGLNGPPERAQLRAPRGLVVSPSGIIYIADTDNNRIVKIDVNPAEKRLGGTGGTP